MHRNTRRVLDAAQAAGLAIDVREFPEGTRTAEDAAAAIGVPVGAIVKSLVLTSDEGPLLVLVSGDNRVDYAKVAAVSGRTGVRRCDAEQARAATGFPIGGTAPLGHATALPVLADRDLLRFDVVWAAAGTPHHNFSAEPAALFAAAGAVVTDVATDPGGAASDVTRAGGAQA